MCELFRAQIAEVSGSRLRLALKEEYTSEPSRAAGNLDATPSNDLRGRLKPTQVDPKQQQLHLCVQNISSAKTLFSDDLARDVAVPRCLSDLDVLHARVAAPLSQTLGRRITQQTLRSGPLHPVTAMTCE